MVALKLIRRFLAAVSFLTRFPLPSGVQTDLASLEESPTWFPAVGALIGLTLAGFDGLACALFHPAVAAVADLVLLFVITGGLHLDGLLDSADGLLSGRPREEALEIMRDSRVGAMGVLVGILMTGLKVALIASLTGNLRSQALLVAPILGRYSILLAIAVFPYARMGQGLGSLFKLKSRPSWPVIPGAVVVAACLALTGWRGAAAVLASFALPLAMGAAVSDRLGGLTGDVYGALCEVVEVAVLSIFAAGWRP